MTTLREIEIMYMPLVAREWQVMLFESTHLAVPADGVAASQGALHSCGFFPIYATLEELFAQHGDDCKWHMITKTGKP